MPEIHDALMSLVQLTLLYWQQFKHDIIGHKKSLWQVTTDDETFYKKNCHFRGKVQRHIEPMKWRRCQNIHVVKSLAS